MSSTTFRHLLRMHFPSDNQNLSLFFYVRKRVAVLLSSLNRLLADSDIFLLNSLNFLPVTIMHSLYLKMPRML